MNSIYSRIAATLVAAALGLGWCSSGSAQEKPKDEGLERLLEKLDEKNKDKPNPDVPKEPSPDKPKENAPDKPKTPGQVAPKDKDIDDLLEGLGQSKDKPSPDDKKPGGSNPGDPSAPKTDKPKPDDLKDNEKAIDRELEGITGKKEAPKDKSKRKGEEDGPLGSVIKEMREVEERLGKPDTGEETRKRQAEIVKNLDQLIEQMKNAPSQASGLKAIREGKKPGQNPGQPGDQPGAMAGNPSPTKPTDPKKPPAPVALDKSIWGQLPPAFRNEMDNVMAEHPLPTKFDLIRLYYLSLGNKSSNREE